MSGTSQPAVDAGLPSIRFVGGNPSDEEVAVVTAVLVAGADAAAVRTAKDAGGARGHGSMWGRAGHVRHARPRSWAESRLPG